MQNGGLNYIWSDLAFTANKFGGIEHTEKVSYNPAHTVS